MGRVLALDYGLKRIGLAVGDLENQIAVPSGVIQNKGLLFAVSEVSRVCEEKGIDLVLVGLPLNMESFEDSENEMVVEVKDFVRELKESLNEVEVELFDERLSSFEADEIMREANITGRDKKTSRDEIAAQVILQRYFDKD